MYSQNLTLNLSNNNTITLQHKAINLEFLEFKNLGSGYSQPTINYNGNEIESIIPGQTVQVYMYNGSTYVKIADVTLNNTTINISATSNGNGQLVVNCIQMDEADPNSLHLDGSNSPTNHINWNGKRITNLGAPVNNNDAMNKQYADIYYLNKLTGGTLSGNINMNNHKITGLSNPTDLGDAVNLNTLNNALMKDGSNVATGNLNLGMHRITNLADPVNDQDAVNKQWVLGNVSAIPNPKTDYTLRYDLSSSNTSTELPIQTLINITNGNFFIVYVHSVIDVARRELGYYEHLFYLEDEAYFFLSVSFDKGILSFNGDTTVSCVSGTYGSEKHYTVAHSSPFRSSGQGYSSSNTSSNTFTERVIYESGEGYNNSFGASGACIRYKLKLYSDSGTTLRENKDFALIFELYGVPHITSQDPPFGEMSIRIKKLF